MGVGPGQPAGNRADRFYGAAVGEGSAAAADEGLHRVGEGIETTGSRDRWRQTDHQFGVDHRDLWKQLEIGNGEFALPLVISEHRGDRGFRSGAGGGGDAGQRWWRQNHPKESLHGPAAHPGVGGAGADRLGAVDHRAAPHGHQAVAASLAVSAQTCFHTGDGGIVGDLVKHPAGSPGALEFLNERLGKLQVQKLLIGDQQWPLPATPLKLLRQRSQCACTDELAGLGKGQHQRQALEQTLVDTHQPHGKSPSRSGCSSVIRVRGGVAQWRNGPMTSSGMPSRS